MLKQRVQYDEQGSYWNIYYAFLRPPKEFFSDNRRQNEVIHEKLERQLIVEN